MGDSRGALSHEQGCDRCQPYVNAAEPARHDCPKPRRIPTHGGRVIRKPCNRARCVSAACRRADAAMKSDCYALSIALGNVPTHTLTVRATSALIDGVISAAEAGFLDALADAIPGVKILWRREWSRRGKWRRHMHADLIVPAGVKPPTKRAVRALWKDCLPEGTRVRTYCDAIESLPATARYRFKSLRDETPVRPPFNFKGNLYGTRGGFLAHTMAQLRRMVLDRRYGPTGKAIPPKKSNIGSAAGVGSAVAPVTVPSTAAPPSQPATAPIAPAVEMAVIPALAADAGGVMDERHDARTPGPDDRREAVPVRSTAAELPHEVRGLRIGRAGGTPAGTPADHAEDGAALRSVPGGSAAGRPSEPEAVRSAEVSRPREGGLDAADAGEVPTDGQAAAMLGVPGDLHPVGRPAAAAVLPALQSGVEAGVRPTELQEASAARDGDPAAQAVPVVRRADPAAVSRAEVLLPGVRGVRLGGRQGARAGREEAAGGGGVRRGSAAVAVRDGVVGGVEAADGVGAGAVHPATVSGPRRGRPIDDPEGGLPRPAGGQVDQTEVNAMASDPMTDQRPHERTTRTRQCTATSKRTHERCGLSAAPGRNVCKWHGGATPVGGMSHHAVKRVEDHGPGASNGRYSKFLPKNVRALADAMFNDETLFDLKSDLSLLTARVCQLGARLHGGEAGSLWRELKAAWAAFRTATVAKDDAAVRAALDEMDRLVGLGATEDAQWKELLQALAERRATILAEGKRVEQMGLSISPERVMVWGQQLIDCVLRHVRCPETRRAIATEYQRLVGVSSGPRGGDDDGTDDGVRVIG